MMTATVAIIAQAKRPNSRHFCGDMWAWVRSMCWPVRRASSSSMLRSGKLSEDGRTKRGFPPAMVRDLEPKATKATMMGEQKNVYGVKESAPDRRINGVAPRPFRLNFVMPHARSISSRTVQCLTHIYVHL